MWVMVRELLLAGASGLGALAVFLFLYGLVGLLSKYRGGGDA